jgi:AmiR/NasT family two-component response regulator
VQASRRTTPARAAFLVTTMPSALILDLAGPAFDAWRAALEAAGLHRDATSAGHGLVHRTIEENGADELICLAADAGAALERALAPWDGAPPCAVTAVLAAAPDEAAAARLVALGVHHAHVAPVGAPADPAALALARAQARARHAREAELRRTLDERKWVERAKGVLMSARGLGEDDAFRLLRGAAMQVNLRLGEVSRAVTEAARWADAMNRAGQLRMLSLRGVRLVAQRLLRLDARAAAELARETARRGAENLEALARHCAGTPCEAACAHAAQRWQALAAVLAAPRLDDDALGRLDALAERVVAAAEALTASLQAHAGRRAIGLVNQCGRQRLRAQRAAKASLLAAAASDPDAAAALARQRDAALSEFEQAQAELERLPLSSPAIRTTLAQVREHWLRLVAGLRARDPVDGRRAVVHASEALVEHLDALTHAYEHSLEVIMG